MKYPIILLLLALHALSWKPGDGWLKKSAGAFTIWYAPADKENVKDYIRLLQAGTDSVTKFFGGEYQNKFFVFVYTRRSLLDSAWRAEWKLPAFTSGCWMVASGVAAHLDMISPSVWRTEACEHNYADRPKTLQLITHELVHVYHGQQNYSQDFSDVDNMDWFIEGVATYASGQCDAERMKDVHNAIATNTAPGTVDSFWTGKLKYGLAGSMVMYIDKKYGRQKLKQLLPFNKKWQVLQALGITDEELIKGWKGFMGAGKND